MRLYGLTGFAAAGLSATAAFAPYCAFSGAMSLSAIGLKCEERFEDSLPPSGWEAYFDGGECPLYQRTPRSTRSGLYSCRDESWDGGTALGFLAKQQSSIVFGLSFRNDTGLSTVVESIGFDAGRWNHSNTKSDQRISFEWRISREEGSVLEGEWTEVESLSTDIPMADDSLSGGPVEMARREISPAGIKIAPGEILFVRWVFNGPEKSKGSSALVAIDGLSIRFRMKGFVLLIK